MRKIAITIFIILLSASFANAVDQVETVTFAWDQEDRVLLEKWEMHWGDAAGGPYVKLSDLAYGGEDQTNFESPIEATVSGEPASTVTKHFVLRACGTVEGAVECSDWSNEVSYGFKIPFDGFQVPVNFRIIAQ
jgi:hypothetical protein